MPIFSKRKNQFNIYFQLAAMPWLRRKVFPFSYCHFNITCTRVRRVLRQQRYCWLKNGRSDHWITLNFSIVFLLQKRNLNITTTIICLFWLESSNRRAHQLLFTGLAGSENLHQPLQCAVGSAHFHREKSAISFRISDSLVTTSLLLFTPRRSKICPSHFWESNINPEYWQPQKRHRLCHCSYL